MSHKKSKIFKHLTPSNLLLKLTPFLIIFWISTSCSNSKNKFVNKTYHKITLKYNVLFNGNKSLEKAEEIIVENYRDNFREILPISPFETGMTAFKASSQLKKVSDKATKAIQKHSMNIGGIEYNTHIDKAYLLLGKGRYYKSKFLPALEAFNYIKLNFRSGKVYYDALLWSARTQIELANYSLAANEINEILDNPNCPTNLKPQLYAHYSDAMLQQKKYHSAIKSMIKAVKLEENMRIKTRYAYILAQMYRLDGINKKSTEEFEKVIDIGTPYKYVFHAKLDKAENFNADIDESDSYIPALEKMLKEKKNDNDKEKIYYAIASIYYKNKDYKKAEENLKTSISEAKIKKFEKGLAFEMLGNVYFDKTEYKYAAIYFDSTLTAMSESYKNYRSIARKRKQLTNVIKFINIAERNDSILKIVSMDDEAQTIFFDNYIVWLKSEDARKQEEAKEAALLAEQNNSNGSSLVRGKAGGFYLYNPITIQNGRLEFEKKWGDRPLQDQWRILSKPINNIVEETKDETNNEEVKSEPTDIKEQKETINPLYTPGYYISQLPTNPDTLAVMKTDRDFAYYALGLIYNEQFVKYELSAKTLETLLEYNPEEDIKLPTYYYLYKNYKSLKHPKKQNKYKSIITDKYPNSRYAAIINNPEYINKDGKQGVDLLYENLIKNFRERNFRKAITISDVIIKNYPTENVMPKVELIKALVVGKLGTPQEYEKSLKYVMYNYPNDDVSERAKIYLSDLDRDEKRKFNFSNKKRPRIVFYADADTDLSKIKSSIDYKIWQKKLSTSTSSFSHDKNVFVIFNFKNWKQAEDFKNDFLSQDLMVENNLDKNVEIFIISQYNFNILQRKKNINFYLQNNKNLAK